MRLLPTPSKPSLSRALICPVTTNSSDPYLPVLYTLHLNPSRLRAGIIERVPGEAAAVEVSPVVRVLDELKASHSASGGSGQDLDGLVSLIDELRGLCCSGEGSENAAIAVWNGGVEALVNLCGSVRIAQEERLLVSALKALSSMLRGMTLVSLRVF